MIPLLLFLAVPAAEIYLFIEVGGQIGAWPTIAMIFGTAMVGGAILRFQGRQMIARAREQDAKRELPIAEIADGAVLVLAALFLLTPGFITDALGALLLIPLLRRLVFALLLLALRARPQKTSQQTGPGGSHTGGPIIDAQFEDISDADKPPPNTSNNPPPNPRRIDRD
jgi:UPF0716 protein FxsA